MWLALEKVVRDEDNRKVNEEKIIHFKYEHGDDVWW